MSKKQSLRGCGSIHINNTPGKENYTFESQDVIKKLDDLKKAIINSRLKVDKYNLTVRTPKDINKGYKLPKYMQDRDKYYETAKDYREAHKKEKKPKEKPHKQSKKVQKIKNIEKEEPKELKLTKHKQDTDYKSEEKPKANNKSNLELKKEELNKRKFEVLIKKSKIPKLKLDDVDNKEYYKKTLNKIPKLKLDDVDNKEYYKTTLNKIPKLNLKKVKKNEFYRNSLSTRQEKYEEYKKSIEHLKKIPAVKPIINKYDKKEKLTEEDYNQLFIYKDMMKKNPKLKNIIEKIDEIIDNKTKEKPKEEIKTETKTEEKQEEIKQEKEEFDPLEWLENMNKDNVEEYTKLITKEVDYILKGKTKGNKELIIKYDKLMKSKKNYPKKLKNDIKKLIDSNFEIKKDETKKETIDETKAEQEKVVLPEVIKASGIYEYILNSINNIVDMRNDARLNNIKTSKDKYVKSLKNQWNKSIVDTLTLIDYIIYLITYKMNFDIFQDKFEEDDIEDIIKIIKEFIYYGIFDKNEIEKYKLNSDNKEDVEKNYYYSKDFWEMLTNKIKDNIFMKTDLSKEEYLINKNKLIKSKRVLDKIYSFFNYSIDEFYNNELNIINKINENIKNIKRIEYKTKETKPEEKKVIPSVKKIPTYEEFEELIKRFDGNPSKFTKEEIEIIENADDLRKYYKQKGIMKETKPEEPKQETEQEEKPARKRGRPKGSKNKKKGFGIKNEQLKIFRKYFKKR